MRKISLDNIGHRIRRPSLVPYIISPIRKCAPNLQCGCTKGLDFIYRSRVDKYNTLLGCVSIVAETRGGTARRGRLENNQVISF